MKPLFVSYRRVSTREQGESGLGLEAQAKAIGDHIFRAGGDLIADYTEVESGRNCKRVELAKALSHAKRSKATLIIGKLDRLSRNAAFLMNLLESGVEIVAADNPSVNRLTLQILAVLAENEARSISERTKAALAALKERGGKLGSNRPGHWDGKEHLRLRALEKARVVAVEVMHQNRVAAYADILPIMKTLRGNGKTLKEVAEHLNDAGHTSRRGKRWTAMQVFRVLKMDKVEEEVA
jgi:DNA invertase Pin-like site-specific DNA recombinase